MSIEVPGRQEYAYSFDEPHDPAVDLRDLLGNKGAGLSEMASLLGLPVPAGFTITVGASREFRRSGWKREFDDTLDEQLLMLERRTDRRLGDATRPLLVSVRSGAVVSMPGMMDTILNVGLNDETVRAFAVETGDERFASDCYRRLISMFATTVLQVPKKRFEDVLDDETRSAGVQSDADLSLDSLRRVISAYLRIVDDVSGAAFPQHPRQQLAMAVEAVFRSWDSSRAVDFRRIEKITGAEGTAVTVQAMVFGNRGFRSGTGVAFSRDPVSGAPGLTGDWLDRAQGEDVVAGTRMTLPLASLAEAHPDAYRQLEAAARVCERRARDLVDLEFTVEDGALWMLQTRAGRRSATATVRVAVDLEREGRISAIEAVSRVSVGALDRLLSEAATSDSHGAVASGLAASAGVAVGRVYFTADDAVDAADRGEAVLLVRPETSPDDIAGMDVAEGILTSRGGMMSHAAVVARSWGKPAVVGVQALSISEHQCTIAGQLVHEGEIMSIDGGSGDVFIGTAMSVGAAVSDDVERLMDLADAVRGSRPVVLARRDDVETGPPGELWPGAEVGDAGISVWRRPDQSAEIHVESDSTAARDATRRAVWQLHRTVPDLAIELVDADVADPAWAQLVVELGIDAVWIDAAQREVARLALAHAFIARCSASGNER